MPLPQDGFNYPMTLTCFHFAFTVVFYRLLAAARCFQRSTALPVGEGGLPDGAKQFESVVRAKREWNKLGKSIAARHDDYRSGRRVVVVVVVGVRCRTWLSLDSVRPRISR